MDIENIRKDFPILQKKRRKWPAKLILKELRQAAIQMKRTPRIEDLARKGRWDLIRASQRKFGTYTNALKKAGLRANLTYWSKDLIVAELKIVYKQCGHTPTYRELRKTRMDLQSAIERHFKKYNNAIKAADLPLNNIRWSQSKVINELQKVSEKINRTPTERDLKSLKLFDLFGAAILWFGSYNNAIIASGLKPNKSFVNDDFWKSWENFVIQSAEALYGKENVKKHFKLPNKSKPDVFIENIGKSIEAKLNISTDYISNDIYNYSPYSNQIEFWHLYGNSNINQKNIKFLNPDCIENILKKLNLKNLLRNFYLLKKGIKPESQTNIDSFGGKNV